MIKKLTMENQSLTSNWEYGTLEDAVNKGSSNISLNKLKEDDGEYQLYSAKGYNKNISFFHQEKEYLAIIKDGAGVGRVSKHPAKSSVVATMQYLIPKEGFDIGFIQYFLNGIDFESHRQGSTIPHVYFKDYKSEPFPLLPLTQQKQIVAILDKAFAAIDTAKINAEQNLQNAKELRISITNNLFNSVENSDLLIVDEVTDFITDYVANGSFASLKENVSYKKEKDYAMLLRLVDHSKKYQNPFVYVDKHAFDFLKKSTVYQNDIILSNVGARLGTAFRAPDLGIPMTLGPNSILIKAKEFGDYFYCWLQSAYGQKAIKSVVSGAGQPKFNKTQFKKIKVPIPKSKDDRDNIILKINQANNSVDKLYGVYIKKIDDLEEMKKSILQKAFSGQLNTIN